MPKLHHIQKLTDNLAIGVQVGQGSGAQGVWTARIKFPKNNAIYRTTHVKHDPGSSTIQRIAERRAFEILSSYADKYSKGHILDSPNYIRTLVDGTRYSNRVNVMEDEPYLDQMATWGKANDDRVKDGQKPIYKYPGGRGFITFKKSQVMVAYWRKYLMPFVKAKPLPKTQSATSLEDMTKRDWDKLDEYLSVNEPQLSLATRLHIITEARHFLHWAYDKGFIDDVPSIKRPHRGGVRGARETMRREITPDDYLRMMKHTREMYLDASRNRHDRDYSFLFHLWILIIANTGIRPPTNGVPHTMLKWEDVNLDTTDKLKPTLARTDEKGHAYEAIIMPQSVRYWEEIKKFYQSKEMDTDKGYVFRHWYDNPPLWRREQHIKSFNTQWNNMTKKLDLAPVNAPQSQRVSPSSLRAWFITQRFYSDKTINILELARAVGSSVGQLEQRYVRLDMAKSYDHLTAGGWDSKDKEPIYIDGYYAGHDYS